MPSSSDKQAKYMTANCKSSDFRNKTGMDQDVACKFHGSDKGKWHESGQIDEFLGMGMTKEKLDMLRTANPEKWARKVVDLWHQRRTDEFGISTNDFNAASDFLGGHRDNVDPLVRSEELNRFLELAGLKEAGQHGWDPADQAELSPEPEVGPEGPQSEGPYAIVWHGQTRENYGAHDWDGQGQAPQQWKSKGDAGKVLAKNIPDYAAAQQLADKLDQVDRSESNDYFQVHAGPVEIVPMKDLGQHFYGYDADAQQYGSAPEHDDASDVIDMAIEGKSPHKKGTGKYKKHMAAMHAGMSEEGLEEMISHTDALELANVAMRRGASIPKIAQDALDYYEKNEDVEEGRMNPGYKDVSRKAFHRAIKAANLVRRMKVKGGEPITYWHLAGDPTSVQAYSTGRQEREMYYVKEHSAGIEEDLPGYDAWKTQGPYDNEPDERDVEEAFDYMAELLDDFMQEQTTQTYMADLMNPQLHPEDKSGLAQDFVSDATGYIMKKLEDQGMALLHNEEITKFVTDKLREKGILEGVEMDEKKLEERKLVHAIKNEDGEKPDTRSSDIQRMMKLAGLNKRLDADKEDGNVNFDGIFTGVARGEIDVHEETEFNFLRTLEETKDEEVDEGKKRDVDGDGDIDSNDWKAAKDKAIKKSMKEESEEVDEAEETEEVDEDLDRLKELSGIAEDAESYLANKDAAIKERIAAASNKEEIDEIDDEEVDEARGGLRQNKVADKADAAIDRKRKDNPNDRPFGKPKERKRDQYDDMAKRHNLESKEVDETKDEELDEDDMFRKTEHFKEGSLSRYMVEMIVDEMNKGLKAEEITETLSFDPEHVIHVVEFVKGKNEIDEVDEPEEVDEADEEKTDEAIQDNSFDRMRKLAGMRENESK